MGDDQFWFFLGAICRLIAARQGPCFFLMFFYMVMRKHFAGMQVQVASNITTLGLRWFAYNLSSRKCWLELSPQF